MATGVRDYTTTALLNGIKRRGGFESSNNTYSNADLLEMANDDLQSVLFPKMIELNSQLFVTSEDFTFTSASTYDIPAAALGTKIKDVVLLDSSGVEQDIPMIDQKQVSNRWTVNNFRKGFFLRGNKIVFHPAPTQGNQFRVYYYKRPNELVVESAAIQVSSIDSDTNTLTTSDTIPSAWTTGDLVCCIKGTPNFDLVFEGDTSGTISNPTIIVTDVSDVTVGDWIALDGDTPIPQIPFECFSWLQQSVVCQVMQAFGDPGFPIHLNKLQRLERDMLNLLSPRVDDEPRKIINRNRTLYWI